MQEQVSGPVPNPRSSHSPLREGRSPRRWARGGPVPIHREVPRRPSCIWPRSRPSPESTVFVVTWALTPLAGSQCHHSCQRYSRIRRSPEEQLGPLCQDHSSGKKAHLPVGRGVFVQGARDKRMGSTLAQTCRGPPCDICHWQCGPPLPCLRFCPRLKAATPTPSLHVVSATKTLLALEAWTRLRLWPIISLICPSAERDSFQCVSSTCSQRTPTAFPHRDLDAKAPVSVSHKRLSPVWPKG